MATGAQPYLVKVAPGVYTEHVTLKDFVDVEGSGRYVTSVRRNNGWPTVTAGAAANLRGMTISNTSPGAFGSGGGATGVHQAASSANGFTQLVDVNVLGIGPGENRGVSVDNGTLHIIATEVQAGPNTNPVGASTAVALLSNQSAFVRVRDSRLFVNSSAVGTRGVIRRNDASTVLVNNSLLDGAEIVGVPTLPVLAVIRSPCCHRCRRPRNSMPLARSPAATGWCVDRKRRRHPHVCAICTFPASCLRMRAAASNNERGGDVMEASAGNRVARATALVAFACSIVLAPVAASATELALAPNPWLAVDRNRDGIVADVVSRWAEVTKSAKTGVLSETALREALAKLRADQLFSASLAGNYAALLNVFVEAGALSDGKTCAKPQQKVAGSGPELVYTPITPCRILDSRFGVGGSFTAGATQPFKATNPAGTFSSQGGSPTNCGIPVKAAAVTLNFTVFNTGAGPAFIAAWPFNQPNPGTATLNWTSAGAQVANGAVLPLCKGAGCTADFQVFASSNTDMVADVVGYFTEPSGGFVLTVAPSGAQYTSIQAAIDAAAAVATQAQPYLVKVAPGTYTEQITLKNYVDLEGSGINLTQISWSAGWPTMTRGSGGGSAQPAHRQLRDGAAARAGFRRGCGVHGPIRSGFTVFRDVSIWAQGPNDAYGIAMQAGRSGSLHSDVTGGTG